MHCITFLAAAIRQKKKLSKKKEIEGSSDSEEESISKKSKKTSIRRGKVEIDDGLIENYQERLKYDVVVMCL